MSYTENYEKLRKNVMEYLTDHPGGMEDLSKLMGISLFTLARIVKGDRPVRDGTLEKAEDFFSRE